MFGVVGRKVLISVRLLSSSFLVNLASKKGMLLFSSSSLVKTMLPMESAVFKCCCNFFAFPLWTRQMTSSTYFFQLLSWQSSGAVAMIFCSSRPCMGIHGYSKRLLVNFPSKSEVCCPQYKCQQFHDVVYTQVGSLLQCLVFLQSCSDDLTCFFYWSLHEQWHHIVWHEQVSFFYCYLYNFFHQFLWISCTVFCLSNKYMKWNMKCYLKKIKLLIGKRTILRNFQYILGTFCLHFIQWKNWEVRCSLDGATGVTFDLPGYHYGLHAIPWLAMAEICARQE